MNNKPKSKLRAVLRTEYDPERKATVDYLECGHVWIWVNGDPKTGWGGSNAANKRRCTLCVKTGKVD